jgi:hypothetical protein
LGHRVGLDHHSFARQLPRIFGKYGNAREAEDQPICLSETSIPLPIKLVVGVVQTSVG